ncbi:hypothetical protein FEM03_00615 [Phragmitibacter flavus]|uniref:DUF4013 domain-containing protein n=1 Tax=Phragmitibacter flavus TaxID=2576071 RepID=A0A5R8KJY9_9BACT|nr:hypothetical protein [Phragmitibacter flavus]TLD72612.1 hypothetical protein FEM03_00615 [Phragmitibacter flavus]
MKYVESITDFFQQPNYVKNLLFGGLCMLIPIVGPMVLLGWLSLGFWARQDQDPKTFPDFDFGKFGIYLQRGLWPFLVLFAAMVGMWLVILIVLGIPGFILGMIAGDNGFLSAIVGFIMFLLSTAVWLAAILILKPLKIRAVFAQDFVPSFDFVFIKRFLTLMWMESLICTVLVGVAGMVLLPIGAIAFCVGMYVVMALIAFAVEHLDRQLYQIYLARGGEPLPMSPLLSDSAPV